jgi:hypothetical protein
LAEAARPLLQDGLTPRQFLDVLLAKEQYKAAVDFVAHALPPREAVWWGCICLRHLGGPKLPPLEEAACKAALQWVLDPTEENRRAAEEPGTAAGFGTAAGTLAMAAFWSGGSIAPPKLPAVPAAPFMTAKAVAGAVMLLSTKADPLKITDTQRIFVEMGIGVADGSVVWPEFKKKAPAKK